MMVADSGERLEELAAFPDHSAVLASLVGQAAGKPNLAPDAVNVPMIRHWVEAMGDRNPVYVDDDAAREAGFPGIIAPPTMLQAWIMRGYRATAEVEAARSARAPARCCRSPRRRATRRCAKPPDIIRDRKSTRLNSSHVRLSRMPSSA